MSDNKPDTELLQERLGEALRSRYTNLAPGVHEHVATKLLEAKAVALDADGELFPIDRDAIARYAPELTKRAPASSEEGRRRASAFSRGLDRGIDGKRNAFGPAYASRHSADEALDRVKAAATPEESRKAFDDFINRAIG